MRYGRTDVAGGTYFFTVNLDDRSSCLLVEHIDDLRAAVSTVKQRHPFEIVAWVVLPEHMHAIWTLPDGDRDFSTRRSLIKSGFSRAIANGEVVSASRAGKRERGIWQRRFWKHWIRNEIDLQRHVDYVHINPVKHWARNARGGLATFVDSPLHRSRLVGGRLGVRCRRRRRWWRAGLIGSRVGLCRWSRLSPTCKNRAGWADPGLAPGEAQRPVAATSSMSEGDDWLLGFAALSANLQGHRWCRRGAIVGWADARLHRRKPNGVRRCRKTARARSACGGFRWCRRRSRTAWRRAGCGRSGIR